MSDDLPPSMPRIQVKRKDDEERRGGGIVLPPAAQEGGGLLYRLFGLGGPGGGAIPASGQAAGGGFAEFLSSTAGLATAAVVLSAVAAAGLWMSQREGGSRPAELGTVFPSSAQPAASARVEPGASGASSYEDSLRMFSNANRKPSPASEAAPPEKPDVAAPKADAVAAAKAAAPAAAAAGPRMASSSGLGGASGGTLSGGPGLSGGFGRSFDKVTRSSAFQPLLSSAGSDQGQARRGMKPIVQGKSMEQLRFTSKQSQNAATQNASEGQSSGSSRAFEGLGFTNGKTPGEGSVRNGSSDANPGSDPSEGGPILGQNPKEAASVPSTGSSSDKSPWTTALMMGVALLGTASVIITLEGMLVQAGNKNLILKSKLQPMAMALAAMAAALAASAAGIGAMIMAKYGQMQQGLALTIGGSITTAAAIASLLVPSQFAAMTMVIGGISGLVASMAAMITGMTGNKV